jgi:transposase-like protein
MAKRTRRNHTTEQKAALLKRHLVEKIPVSDLCEEQGLQPSVFYHWQRQLFENAATVLATSKSSPSREKALEDRIAHLEARLAKKDEVIAEISQEYVTLKKELGEL